MTKAEHNEIRKFILDNHFHIDEWDFKKWEAPKTMSDWDMSIIDAIKLESFIDCLYINNL